MQVDNGSRLSQFKVLTFDVYGTLIDSETGIASALKPLVVGTPLESKTAAYRTYEDIEKDLQARYPEMRKTELLARLHADYRAHLKTVVHASYPNQTLQGAADSAVNEDTHTASKSLESSKDSDAAFARSLGQWPVFPDTIPALTYLSQHFALTVLSNVDHESFAKSRLALEGPLEARRFAFAAVYTAEDAGAYKPDPRARRYSLEQIEKDFGCRSDEVLVVANSVHHDIVPSRRMGLATAWIARPTSVIDHDLAEGNKATFVFATLGDMADALRKELDG